jgi:hypothetical protein
VVRSLAVGKVSSSTATTIAQIVKVASGIVGQDQAEAIKSLAAKIEELERDRVLTVGRR